MLGIPNSSDLGSFASGTKGFSEGMRSNRRTPKGEAKLFK
jgi:hypothetical protein